MKNTEQNTIVRMVLTEKAPFLITIALDGVSTPYDTYLVRQCVSIDELEAAWARSGIKINNRKNLKKSLFIPSYHYIIVDGVAEGRLLEKYKCRKIARGEWYSRVISEEIL
jgi:hypothetical protein